MASILHSWTDGLALHGLVGTALQQHSKSFIEDAIQELKLKLKGELYLITNKQIAFLDDIMTIIEELRIG